tara:strand:- start:276 stop:488 length:213 start_codon:yes stop_codon:yes gene_type:complete
MREYNKNMITKVVTTTGVYLFNTLQDAQVQFPDLAINVNGKNFTGAMHDVYEGADIMRFEDWKTYQRMSN